MTTQTTQGYDVRMGRTEIEVPHKDGSDVFIHPAEGPGNYQESMKKIIDRGLKPSGGNVSFLAHAAYCGPETVNDKPFRGSSPVANVKEIMQGDWIWVARRKLWTPKDFGELGAGVFSVCDEEGLGLSKPLRVSQLEKALKNGVELREGVISTSDGKIRFASESSYTLGNHTHASLKNDGNVIVDYDIEGARKLSEVSEVIGGNPYVYGLDVSKLKGPEQRLSALLEDDEGLLVNGNFDDDGRSHAFGVLK